eukprot:UN02082
MQFSRFVARRISSNLSPLRVASRYFCVSQSTKLSASVEQNVNVNVDDLWEVVSDFANLDYVPIVDKTTKEGPDGLKQVRKLYFADNGGVITEICTVFDPKKYELGYSIIDSTSPVTESFSDYDALVQLNKIKNDDNQTNIKWTGTYTLNKGFENNVAQDTIKGIYETIIPCFVPQVENKK